ncbi:MAG: Spy/CpxP family protein refolding chaperone [Acidobacteriota bacterium]
MRPSFLGRVLIAALVWGVCSFPAAAQTGFAWWTNDQVVRELALTNEQSTRIDNVFRDSLPQMRQSKQELDRQEAELSRLIETNADEAQVVRQVDKVEAVRASLNKMRTIQLVRMRQVLTSKQKDKFKAVFEQWQRDNPRPSTRDGGRDGRDGREGKPRPEIR